MPRESHLVSPRRPKRAPAGTAPVDACDAPCIPPSAGSDAAAQIAPAAARPAPVKPTIVTVDGPGGSGKSTVSRILARRLGLPYLNSGYIYRTVTVLVLQHGGDFDDRAGVESIIRSMRLRFEEDERSTRVFVDDRDVTSRLKAPDVTPQVWRIANDGGYRSLLVDLQRRTAEPRGVVAEGRDMGTVIFPDAEHKFYLDAAPEVRAQRQYKDLQAAGHSRSYEDVLREVVERDRHDSDRKDAPLRVAQGAVVIRTDDLSVEEVVGRMLSSIRARPGRGERVPEASRSFQSSRAPSAGVSEDSA